MARFCGKREIVVYVDHNVVVRERREHDLTQKEIQHICSDYDARFIDVRAFPNRLGYVEYYFKKDRH